MKEERKKIRVLIAKLGLDGHDRGAKIVSTALRDAGMEVIYTGLKKAPQDIVKIAIEEDVDVIGISLLSGAHTTLIPELCELLKQNEAADIPVVVGGIIPKDDFPLLKQSGVQAIFGPGTKTEEIVRCVKSFIK